MYRDAVGEIRDTIGHRRMEQAFGRRALVVVYFRIAFVGRDQKVVAVRGIQEFGVVGRGHDLTGRVIGATGQYDLRARERLLGDRAEIHAEVVARIDVDEIGFGAREQRGPFVDLIERVGHDDHGSRVAGTVDLCVDDGIQGLAAPGAWQDMTVRVKGSFREHEPMREPACDRVTERIGPARLRVDRQGIEAGGKLGGDDLGRRMPGLAYGHVDRGYCRRREACG